MIVRYNKSHLQALHLYQNLLGDINVEASTCDSLYRTVTNFFVFAVLEQWLIYDCETECSFVYLIFTVLLHKGNDSNYETDLSVDECK